MNEDDKLELIMESHKWADGFTKVKTNKLQRKLGDGCNYGMMYIYCGFGLPIHLPLGLLLYYITNNSNFMGISMILYFIFGILIELYCAHQRDKIMYNEIINNRMQINLFRDFNLKK